MGINCKLAEIQSKLKAPKNQHNNFGNYNYRSCEDILEGVKPLLKENGVILTLSDEITQIGSRIYVTAIAKLTDTETGEAIATTASAREAESKKGMDDSQITGCASSYARKYALNGLFCIDDTKDADTNENARQQEANDTYKCEKCGIPFTEFDWNGKHYTAKDGYEIAKRKCGGKALCNKCKKEAGL